jgi:hypothetical protein
LSSVEKQRENSTKKQRENSTATATALRLREILSERQNSNALILGLGVNEE